jgi:hypothetical protein
MLQRRLPLLSILATAGLILPGCGAAPTAPPGNPRAIQANAFFVPEFKIAQSNTDDQGFAVATDGTDFLVGYKTGNPALIKAQKVLADGSLGTVRSTGRTGDPPLAAFDGTQYLLAWRDLNSGLNGPSNIFGQFISSAGIKVGSPFQISTENTVKTLSGLAFGAGTYLVTYRVANAVTSKVELAGRLVSTAGAAGPALLIGSSRLRGSFNTLTSDGGNFLAAWVSGSGSDSVLARLIRPNGTMASTVTLNGSTTAKSPTMGVAFVAPNYLTVWTDSVGLDESNIYGRLVNTRGQLNGGRITIATTGGHKVTTGVSAYCCNFFVTWIELNPDPTLIHLKGRFFSNTGTAAGGPKTLFSFDPATGKIPVGAAPAVAVDSVGLFVVDRALPGADPEDLSQFNAWDLHAAIKKLTP